MVNIAVFAPIPRASVSTAVAVNPGVAQETSDGVTEIAAQNIHTA